MLNYKEVLFFLILKMGLKPCRIREIFGILKLVKNF